MPRLLVHVEGQTEEEFVKNVLRPPLVDTGYGSVNARLFGNPRLRRRRGGVRSWQSVRNDLVWHLKGDAGAIAALIADFYGMPGDWPGRTTASGIRRTEDKASCVEAALLASVSEELGGEFDPRRFAPLVMMHEFEALLFSDPDKCAQALSAPDIAPSLHEIRKHFDSPEDIDDSIETAPSRRLLRLFRRYEKPLFGNLAAMEIGLPAMRRECPHFSGWLEALEALPTKCSYLG